MKVTPIRTEVVSPRSTTLLELIDTYIPSLTEKSIVAITSKVVALCEGAFVDKNSTTQKEDLIKQDAERYIPGSRNRYNVWLTITKGRMVPSAAIDESNVGDVYALLPRDSQKTANEVRAFLRKKHGLKELGVIITDSTTAPLRWGTMGWCVAYSGFTPLNNYIGTPDLFGREFMMSKSNVAEGLAASAVLVMGEGTECTPLVVIEELSFVAFVDQEPSTEEIASLHIDPEDDLYVDMLQAMPWEEGGARVK